MGISSDTRTFHVGTKARIIGLLPTIIKELAHSHRRCLRASEEDDLRDHAPHVAASANQA
jgi:hypothetical protein